MSVRAPKGKPASAAYDAVGTFKLIEHVLEDGEDVNGRIKKMLDWADANDHIIHQISYEGCPDEDLFYVKAWVEWKCL